MFAISLSACGDLAKLLGGKDEETPTNDKFTEPVSECTGSAIPHRFIVRWTNGQVTVVNAKNRREFFDNVLLKYERHIETAEYDFVVTLDDPPVTPKEDAPADEPEEDPFLNWGPKKVHAQAVWDQGQFGQNITVAVIDSGVDLTIDQLSGQFFVNTGEIAGNGEDDDGNGLIDDVSGYDFFRHSGQVDDLVGHGSHVSGIIAARHDIGKVNGLAPGASILPLNFMDEDGAGTLGDAVAAIDYAVSMGAKVINASWGGAPCSEILKARIKSLAAANVLFVAAAGNNGSDLDVFPEFPAAFQLDAQITVGSSTINDFMSAFSNHSRNLVHLVAPGSNIISTVPVSDSSATKSGTSMATPFVSAAAAIIWSAVPHATALQVKQALIESVDSGPFEVVTDGRLNVEAALTRLRQLAP